MNVFKYLVTAHPFLFLLLLCIVVLVSWLSATFGTMFKIYK